MTELANNLSQITCAQCKHFTVPASQHTPNPVQTTGMGNCAHTGADVFISSGLAACQFKPSSFEPRQEPHDVDIPRFIQS